MRLISFCGIFCRYVVIEVFVSDLSHLLVLSALESTENVSYQRLNLDLITQDWNLPHIGQNVNSTTTTVSHVSTFNKYSA